jgi:hypothetical protein
MDTGHVATRTSNATRLHGIPVLDGHRKEERATTEEWRQKQKQKKKRKTEDNKNCTN